MSAKHDDDDDAIASKILLARASNKRRVQSWLPATSPSEEPVPNDDTPDNTTDFQLDDENAGIGAPKTLDAADDFSTRQLSSANDALRRKLLSKDAYKKYQQGTKSALTASTPMPRQVRKQIDVGSDDEAKGRSPKAHRAIRPLRNEHGGHESTVDGVGSRKKRPISYLDQLLAERGKKTTKKSKGKV